MAAMSAESESDVSGPVAMITGPSSDRGNPWDLFAHERDARMRRDRIRHAAEKPLAIDGERGAGRHAGRVGGAHDDRAEPPHLLLQQTDRVIEFVAAKGIAADEFGELIGLVDRGGAHRPHLVNGDRHTAFGRLPRGFAARQTAADDVNHDK